MKFCMKCGHQNEDDAVFCIGCGANMGTTDAPAPDPYDAGSMQDLHGEAAPAKKSKAPVIAAVSAAAVLLAGGGTCFLLRDQIFGGEDTELSDRDDKDDEKEEDETDEDDYEDAVDDANEEAKNFYYAVASSMIDLDSEGFVTESGLYLFDDAYDAPKGDPDRHDVDPDDADILQYIVWLYYEDYEDADASAFTVGEYSSLRGVAIEVDGVIGTYPKEMTIEALEDIDSMEDAVAYAEEDLEPETEPETEEETEEETEPETEEETEAETDAFSGEYSLPDDDGTLSIVCWTDYDLGCMIEQFGYDYPDYDVQWVECSGAYSGYEANSCYATFLNSGEDVDLFLAEPGWIRNYIETDEYAVPLSALNIDVSDYADAYEYTLQLGTNASGVLMAAGWDINPGGFCYNTDMAEQYLGVTTPEEMQAMIGDWDGFENVAATLADNGITVCASLGGLWQAYGTPCNGWASNGTLDTGYAEDFTAMAKRFIDNGYVDPDVGQWWDDWYVAGQNGSTFGYFFSSWCLSPGAQLEQCMGSAGNVNVVAGPEAYFWGGSMFCVSKNCNSASMAEEFLRYFTVNTDTMYDFAMNYGYYVNSLTVMADLYYNNPLLGGQDEIAVLAETAKYVDMSGIGYYDQVLKDTYLTVLTENYAASETEIVERFTEEALSIFPELY